MPHQYHGGRPLVLALIAAALALSGCVQVPAEGLDTASPQASGAHLAGFTQQANATEPKAYYETSPPPRNVTEASPKGTIFEDPASPRDPPPSTQRASVVAKESRQDVSWAQVWVKSERGVHYNLNQAAKAADSDATDWSRVFGFDAPFRGGLDLLQFCGPTASITLQVADSTDWTLLYQGTVTEVPPCE